MRKNEPWRIVRAFILGPLIEVAIPKPGNVSRFHDFSDLSFYNFLFAETSVVDVYFRLASGEIEGIGKGIKEAVLKSKEVQSANPNFGIITLSVPLIMALSKNSSVNTTLKRASDIIRKSKPEDSVFFYMAIKEASPKGLKENVEYDVNSDESLKKLIEDGVNLWKLAKMSCERELIFCEWLNEYELTYRVFKRMERLFQDRPLEEAVRTAFVELMAEVRDTLIERRAGKDTAERIREMARMALKGEIGMDELDRFLREDERRNPGSLADVTAVAISLNLLDGYRFDRGMLTRTSEP